MNVLPFTGGKRCIDCSFQIEPARVAANPETKRCLECQVERETAIKVARRAARPNDVEIIRG